MAVPKTKISKSKRDMRRAHHALKATNVSECANCGELVRSHHMCDACGSYNGKTIVNKES